MNYLSECLLVSINFEKSDKLKFINAFFLVVNERFRHIKFRYTLLLWKERKENWLQFDIKVQVKSNFWLTRLWRCYQRLSSNIDKIYSKKQFISTYKTISTSDNNSKLYCFIASSMVSPLVERLFQNSGSEAYRLKTIFK